MLISNRNMAVYSKEKYYCFAIQEWDLVGYTQEPFSSFSHSSPITSPCRAIIKP